ncbi:response regulator [Aminiphilus sp.]|uniref:response regulator n=1 Tax=Aminiphilus sp. TaxID=1872488 RepID=UPI002615E9F4|nr:response regulator [Aminiphilus sp.]
MSEAPLTILLVEDNPAHAEMILRSLAEHEVANHVTWLEDGETALDYLFRRGRYAEPSESPVPFVILLDLRLPRVDGLQVLRQVKEHAVLRDIPVVILTTSEAERDMARAYEYHANSYVVKPLRFDEFAALMKDFGFYWLSWNKRPETEVGRGMRGGAPGSAKAPPRRAGRSGERERHGEASDSSRG